MGICASVNSVDSNSNGNQEMKNTTHNNNNNKMHNPLASVKNIYTLKSRQHISEFIDFGEDDVVLGEGMTGSVLKVKHKVTNEMVALKSVNKKLIRNIKSLKKEIHLLSELDHPNVVKLIASYEDEHYLYMVSELCAGGDLLHQLISADRPRHCYVEDDAREIVKQMCRAVYYVHQNNICHRDIKMDNWLFTGDGLDMKLIDFGLSKRYYNDHDHVRGMKQFLGTPGFVAPEIQRTHLGETSSYGSEVDVWSIGVITFCLLSGKMPFKRKGHDCVSLNSKMGRSYQRHYTEKFWKNKISDDAKDFLDCVLNPDAKERLGVSHLLSHTWFTTSKDNDFEDDQEKDDKKGNKNKRKYTLTDDEEFDAELLKRMQYFANADKIEKAAMTVLAAALHQEDILNLRKTFVEIDTENDGRISWKDLTKIIKEGHADKITKTNIHELFHSIVTDGHEEESLSYTEFLAATMDHHLLHAKDRLKEAFKLMDKENTGYIDISDFETLFKNTPAHATDELSAMIKERSVDGNRISFDNFCAILDDHHSQNVKSFNNNRVDDEEE